jgi:hypothetical protein
MAAPQILLVDELSLGLMPIMVDLCLDALVKLKTEGLSILLVEQNTLVPWTSAIGFACSRRARRSSKARPPRRKNPARYLRPFWGSIRFNGMGAAAVGGVEPASKGVSVRNSPIATAPEIGDPCLR